MQSDKLLVFLDQNPTIFALLIVWSLVWKGLALWKAAQNKSIGWFIAILALNTFGIIEIAYLFYFADRKEKQKKESKDNH